MTKIGSGAFQNCSSLESIVIPESVLSIGRGAFRGCKGMTSVKISNSVQYIADYAFYQCSFMNSLVIGNSVKTIGNNAFYGCSALTSVEIPNYVESIGESAFYSCDRLTSVKFGNSVKTIGDKAFGGCEITELILPPSLETIGAYAFAYNNNTSSIIMGHSVKTIGEYAFEAHRASTVIITAITPPTAPTNIFSNYSGKLRLLLEFVDNYRKASPWKSFRTFDETLLWPTEIKGNTKEIKGKPGETFQLTAELWPTASLPYIFWRSTNPEVATVDINGLVTINSNLSDEGGECKIIAETLYPIRPTLEVNVIGLTTDIDKIVVDNPEAGKIDFEAPYEVYDMYGRKSGNSLDNLSTGVYIVRQGGVAVKVAVQ